MLFAGCAVVSAAAVPLSTRYWREPMPAFATMRQIAKAVPRGGPVAAYGLGCEYLFFKLNRPVHYAQTLDELVDFVDGSGQCCVITDTADAEALARRVQKPLRTLGTWRMGRTSVSVVVAGLPSSAVPASPRASRL